MIYESDDNFGPIEDYSTWRQYSVSSVATELRALLPDESLAPAERGRVLLARVTACLAELERQGS